LLCASPRVFTKGCVTQVLQVKKKVPFDSPTRTSAIFHRCIYFSYSIF
jgi:hypothetical protein